MSLAAVIRDAGPYLESWLQFQLTRSRIPGVQVAVRVGDELVFSAALGQSNALTGEPLTRQHLFHVASHSKTFTATAVMQLVEAGKLRLDDPAGQWVPALDGSPAAQYTVRELLGHMSGINRDGAESDYWQLEADFPDAARLVEFARQDAVYATNEHFKYSNVGYSVLGLIVAAASGRSYVDYVRGAIVDRLALEDLGPEVPADRVADLAGAHAARWSDAAPWQVIPHVGTDAMAAATGFYATAEDLSAYLAQHRDGVDTLLSDDSKRLMRHVEGRVTRGGERFYGLGLIMADVDDRRLVGHSGGWPGHISQSWLDPTTGLVVSVLTNGLNSPASEWATNLIKLIDLAAENAETTAEVPSGVDLADYAGRYQNLWGIEDLAVLGGRLVSLAPGADPKTSADLLTFDGPDTLVREPEAGFGDVGEPVRVLRDADGRVAGIRSGGMTAWPIDDYADHALPF